MYTCAYACMLYYCWPDGCFVVLDTSIPTRVYNTQFLWHDSKIGLINELEGPGGLWYMGFRLQLSY